MGAGGEEQQQHDVILMGEEEEEEEGEGEEEEEAGRAGVHQTAGLFCVCCWVIFDNHRALVPL